MIRDDPSSVLIAQMTDIHIGFDPTTGEDEVNFVRFKRALDHLLAQTVQPDLLILSGDISDSGDPGCYERLKAALSACPFPVYPLVGNHDLRGPLLEAFRDCPSEDGFVQYAINCQDLRILCLDTVEEERHGGAFCEARAAWLTRQLESHPTRPTLIFMHHPPIVSGIDWMDPQPQEPWLARFTQTIAGHDQILRIACGHLHRTLHSRVGSVPISVTPAIAPAVTLDLRRIDPDHPDDRAIVAAEPPGYSLHWWREGVIVTHFQPVGDWEVLARFEETLKPMMTGLFAERKAT